MPGKSAILIKICGSSERAQHLLSLVKEALLVELWEIFLLSSKEVNLAESAASLFSTVHGAGRLLGRTQAKGKRDRKTGKQLTEGIINREEHDAWIKRVGVEVRGSDLDESPYAYKRIEEVLKAHEGTIKILHTLTPIGVCMADDRTFDPYKD